MTLALHHHRFLSLCLPLPMAPPAKFLAFCILLTFLFSLQIHARESQFFSKVTNANNNGKETTTLPNKEETQSKQEQEPNFIPQTQNGYGLYGHESGQFPPTTTTLTNTNAAPYYTTPTTNVPYNSEFEQPVNKNYRNTNYNTNVNPNNNNNNYNYYNKESYGANQNGMSDTRLTGTGGYTTGTVNNPNNYYNGANRYNGERQGMSDTRFMANGKYYHSPNSENNYNPNQYGNSRGVDSKNWYNNNYYGNNNENNNSVEGYQNDELFENDDEWHN